MNNKYFELDQQISEEINSQLIAEGKTFYPVECEDCNGEGEYCYEDDGWFSCEFCNGNGYYEIAITKPMTSQG